MLKEYITNDLIKKCNLSPRIKNLTDKELLVLEKQVKNAILQGIDDKILSLSEAPNDMLIYWVLGLNDKYTLNTPIKSLGSYADIDSDISQAKRGQFLEYVKERYGSDKVVQVATFGTMGAKQAVRNSVRALGYSVDVANLITKHISNEPGAKLSDNINNEEITKVRKENPEVEHSIQVALKLEGLPNSIGTHASAICISDKDITNYLPIMTASRKDAVIVTQPDYKTCESMGILKFDGLGLKTLDVIDLTVRLIKKNKGIDVDIDNIDVNDEGIYKLMNAGHLAGKICHL